MTTEEERDDGCRAYRQFNFTEARAQTIGRIRELVEHYAAAGMGVSVRQIYYQFVARGWAGSGGSVYDMVQSALNDGRLAGLIPWSAVEDRGRGLRGLRTWESPAAALREARERYLRDLWADQPWRPEVWVEKAALEGVVGDICRELRVDFYATRGYDSQSQQWRAGQRLADYVRAGQRPIIFHLGDHDPSGVDMTRDVIERLEMFAGTPITVQRIALTMPQVRQYDPPPFPVKRSDARSDAYRDRYGDNAWELDALEPLVMKQLISDAVALVRDQRLWDISVGEETADQLELDDMIEAAGGEADEEDDDAS